jgi:hypothetical protein
MSVAVIASTTVSEFRLISCELRKLWRMPVMMIAPPRPAFGLVEVATLFEPLAVPWTWPAPATG